jgi:acetyl-CoA carboxylase biotin carboxyl carrier protein
MKLTEIEELIRLIAKSGVNEVSIEQKDFKITIKSDYAAQKKNNIPTQPQIIQAAPAIAAAPVVAAAPVAAAPVASAPQPTPAAPTASSEDNANYITIKSPMIGTFYRSSAPDKASFVNVGDSVDEGSVICIIEAMKLFNEIESEVKGRIVKVLVENATPVEYDQPLFLVEPA